MMSVAQIRRQTARVRSNFEFAVHQGPDSDDVRKSDLQIRAVAGPFRSYVRTSTKYFVNFPAYEASVR